MEKLIDNILEKFRDTNLHSAAGRQVIVKEIMKKIRSKEGWFLNLNSIDGKIPDVGDNEEEAKWVCSICGENTFDVDYGYIGTSYNHLGCELEVEKREKNWLQKNDDDLIIGIANEEKVGVKAFNQAVFGDSRDLTEARIQASSDFSDGWTKQYYKDKLAEEILDNKDNNYLFESPDGGKTVYKRKFGSKERILVKDINDEHDS